MPRLVLLACVLALPAASAADKPAQIKLGMIGLDTSHVVAFAGILNKDNAGPLENIRVVAAFPGGSPDLEDISVKRLPGFTKTLKEKHGVEIVGSIAELLPKVDAVLLESVDGRVHLEQIKPVLAAGKPVFIDKPVAASLADTVEIFGLAAKHKVPVFSSSSLRFGDKLKSLANDPAVGKVQRCDAFYTNNPLKGHPELFFYGIHGIEMLYTVLGTGCESVTWTDGVVTGTWKDGRVGTYRSDKANKVKVTGDKGTAEDKGGNYNGLVKAIAVFLRDGKPPVSAEETTELVAYMVAAEESKKAGGKPVTIESVMKQARDEVAARTKGGR
ncbi:MAG: Gfo/Idh/MocA family protein [Gemmataceae bacterium]